MEQGLAMTYVPQNNTITSYYAGTVDKPKEKKKVACKKKPKSK